MEGKKRFNIEGLIIFIFCLTGCILMIAPVFLEGEQDFFPYNIISLGAGIMVFLYTRIMAKMG